MRECGVYCELKSFRISTDEVRSFRPDALIFTGGPEASRQRFAEGYDSATMGMDSLFYVEMYKNMVKQVWG